MDVGLVFPMSKVKRLMSEIYSAFFEIGMGSIEVVETADVMCICPQKPNILLLISDLKPFTNEVAMSITAILMATAITAIIKIVRVNDFCPPAATRLAIK